MVWRRILLISLMGLMCIVPLLYPQPEVRLKDIVRIVGVRETRLIGYGLVVGLEGTGDSDKTMFTFQAVVNMMERLGMTVDREKMEVENVAAVVVTAEIPPFARPGDRVDVTVSSLGDAESLEGGILLQTPLLGRDGRVYAVASGKVSIGGSNINPMGGLRNFPTVGIVPRGAIIEKELVCPVLNEDGKSVSLSLKRSDFTTASRIVKAINAKFTPVTAKAIDGSLIKVEIPREFKDDVVGFIAVLEDLRITPDTVMKVVVNERTGTVVMGGDVKISKVAVSHGNLSLRVFERVKVPGEEPRIEEKYERVVIFEESPTVDDLVEALNAVGATPRDLVAILQAIDRAGALHGELIIM